MTKEDGGPEFVLVDAAKPARTSARSSPRRGAGRAWHRRADRKWCRLTGRWRHSSATRTCGCATEVWQGDGAHHRRRQGLRVRHRQRRLDEERPADPALVARLEEDRHLQHDGRKVGKCISSTPRRPSQAPGRNIMLLVQSYCWPGAWDGSGRRRRSTRYIANLAAVMLEGRDLLRSGDRAGSDDRSSSTASVVVVAEVLHTIGGERRLLARASYSRPVQAR